MKIYKQVEGTPLRSINSSRALATGTIHPTHNFGDIEIIGQVDRYKTRINAKGYTVKVYIWFVIRFINTNAFVVAQNSSIFTGSISDPLGVTWYGVGFIGIGKWRSKIQNKVTKEYVTWNGMLTRSYSPAYQKENPTYIGCTVDPRWHNFQNFCEDIQELEGYAEWKASNKEREYALDKDTKVEGNKVYSKDTCMFITHLANTLESNDRRRRIKMKGIVYYGNCKRKKQEVYFKNIKKFSDNYGLDPTTVKRCLDKKPSYHQHKGWVFEIKEEKEIE